MSKPQHFDAIIIGAGQSGGPLSMALAEAGMHTDENHGRQRAGGLSRQAGRGLWGTYRIDQHRYGQNTRTEAEDRRKLSQWKSDEDREDGERRADLRRGTLHGAEDRRD